MDYIENILYISETYNLDKQREWTNMNTACSPDDFQEVDEVDSLINPVLVQNNKLVLI